MAAHTSTFRRPAIVAAALSLAGLATAGPAAASPATPVVKTVSPAGGRIAGGNAVTVTGSGFSHVAKVEFGTAAGTHVSVKSSTKLTVVAPKHAAGTVDVRVEVRSGSTTKTSTTDSSDRYTFFAPPAVTAVSPTKGSTKGGTKVTISGSNFRAISKVEFGTATGTRVTVASSTKLTVVAPKHAAGTVDVRIDGRYGTSPVTTRDDFRYAVPTPRWHAIEAPLPSGLGTSPQVDLVSVACPVVTSCAAVGSYRDDVTSSQHGLLDVLTGTHWVGGKAPLPANADGSFSNLNAVACASATSCVAVGGYGDTAQHSVGLIDTRTGGGWTASEAPVPNDAKASPSTTLSSVACPAAGSCVAVGSYINTTNGTEGLIETLANGTWTATEAPKPADADNTNVFEPLSQVQCWSAGACVAVGSYESTSPAEEGVIETLSAGSWHAAKAPLPADQVATFQEVSFSGLSCTSTGSCAAVGTYSDSQGHHAGLIESISGGSAAALEAPVPANGDSTPDTQLGTVSCASASPCVATGFYFDSSAKGQGLFESISGGSAIPSEAPQPAAAVAGQGGLQAIACVSGACRATGFYADSQGAYHGLLETLANGVWSAATAPVPGNAYTATPVSTELINLDAIAYAGANTYVAVGQYPDTRFDTQGLIDTYS